MLLLRVIDRIEYLAEMELGHAPPIEYIEKNLKINPDDYRKQKELSDVLKYGKQYIKEAQNKINEIIEDVNL